MRLRLLALVLVAAACGGDDGDDPFTPTLEDPWHPPGPDHDPDCETQCIPVMETEGHHGGFTFHTNPLDDSPRAQWGKCFAQVMACWEPTADLIECSSAADRCPQPCRDEVVRLADGTTDLSAQVDAFEAVYLEDTAACRQPAADGVSP